MTDPKSAAEALDLLRSIGAPERLIRHGEIVSEVAVEISVALTRLGIQHDDRMVVVGAALHDAGKIVHPEELVGPGHQHETAGERLMLQHGCSTPLARICRTHGRWDEEDAALEDRLVALSDCLWHGVRQERLEGIVIQQIADRLAIDRWQAFLRTDPIFEAIALGSSERLSRALA